MRTPNQEQHPTLSSQSRAAAERKPFVTPSVTEIGSLTELTELGGSGG
jgi:hypothetical protein